MSAPDPLPSSLLAWAARCRALGLAPDLLEGALGVLPATLDALQAAASDPAAAPADAEARRRALLAAAVDQLLAQGRVLEAARLQRSLASGPGRGAAGRAAGFPAEHPPDGQRESDAAAMFAAAFDEDGEDRALWDALGYENWVVPPGCGRRPLASLTAEWVCAADRWRVLEELLRVDDPAERARVLEHFRRAGLDPAADHPAYAGAAASPSPSAPAPPASDPPPCDGHTPTPPASDPPPCDGRTPTPPASDAPPCHGRAPTPPASDPPPCHGRAPTRPSSPLPPPSGPSFLSSPGPPLSSPGSDRGIHLDGPPRPVHDEGEASGPLLSSRGLDRGIHLDGPVKPGHDEGEASAPPCHGRAPTRPSSPLPPPSGLSLLSSSGPDPRIHPAGPVKPGHAEGTEAPPPPPPSRGRNALLVKLGQEAEAYHGEGRRRRAAEAWLQHARELGVPVPPHAILPEDLEPVGAAPSAEPGPSRGREPWPLCPTWHGQPRDPRTGDPLPDPPEAARSWPAGLGPRPPEPSMAWPWPAGDGEPAAARAEREARAPRPAPSGKPTRPRAPAPAAPPSPGGGPDAAERPAGQLMADPPRPTRARRRNASATPSPAPAAPARTSPPPPSPHPTPVVHAQEPLTPYRLARIRGDYPWWL